MTKYVITATNGHGEECFLATLLPSLVARFSFQLKDAKAFDSFTEAAIAAFQLPETICIDGDCITVSNTTIIPINQKEKQ